MGFGWRVAFWHAGWKCKEDYANSFRCSIPRRWMQCSDFSDRHTPGWSTLKNGLWLTVLRSPRDGGRSTLCHDLSEENTRAIQEWCTRRSHQVPSRCDVWSCGVILFALVCWEAQDVVDIDCPQRHSRFNETCQNDHNQIISKLSNINHRILDDFIIIQIIHHLQ